MLTLAAMSKLAALAVPFCKMVVYRELASLVNKINRTQTHVVVDGTNDTSCRATISGV